MGGRTGKGIVSVEVVAYGTGVHWGQATYFFHF
jgi:hypothetical protein